MLEKTESDKVTYQCHLTCRYRGPAHSKGNKSVTQDQSNFIPFIFHNSRTYDCNLFLEELVNKKKDRVKVKILPKTKKDYISIRHGCIRFLENYRLSSSS